VVQDGVSIPFVACCEHRDFVVDVGCPETLQCVGSDEKSLTEFLGLLGHVIVDVRIGLQVNVLPIHRNQLFLVFNLVQLALRVNESLVEVENEEFGEASLFEFEIYLLFLGNWRVILELFDVEDRVEHPLGYILVNGYF